MQKRWHHIEWGHLVRTVVAFVADANKDCRADVRVADDTDTVVFLAETPNRNPGLLTAHNKIWMVLSHFLFLKYSRSSSVFIWRVQRGSRHKAGSSFKR